MNTTTAQKNREAWLDDRKNGIGGSDIGSIMSAQGAFGSPLSVYRSKTDAEPEELSEEQITRFEMGHDSELANAPMFVRRTGCEIVAMDDPDTLGSGCVVRYADPDRVILQSTEWPWLFASPDAFARMPDGRIVIVDFKCAHPQNFKDYQDAARGCSESVYLQLQQYMAVTGIEWGAVSVLGAPGQYQCKMFPRDEAAIASIVHASREFQDLVAAGVAPDPTGHRRDAEAIGAMFGDGDGETIDLGFDFVELDEEIEASAAELKAAKKRNDIARQKMQVAIGEASGGTIPGGVSYSYKSQGRKRGLSMSPEEWAELAEDANPEAEATPARLDRLLGFCEKITALAGQGLSVSRVLRRKAPKKAKKAPIRKGAKA